MRPSRANAAIALLLFASACAHRAPTRVEAHFTHEGGLILLDHPVELTDDARKVRRAVAHALREVTSRWGSIDGVIRIEVLPNHEALEAAVDRRGHPWLRAWARYDTIWLQAPSSFGLLPATSRSLAELLTHELTHVALYRRAAKPTDWQWREIPAWFREGMASVTAAQGYRRAELEELARYVKLRAGAALLEPSAATYRDESDAVYAAAHHAFAFLEHRYGRRRVGAILDRMRDESLTFPEAFSAELGIEQEAFEREFLRYVRTEGWRS